MTGIKHVHRPACRSALCNALPCGRSAFLQYIFLSTELLRYAYATLWACASFVDFEPTWNDRPYTTLAGLVFIRGIYSAWIVVGGVWRWTSLTDFTDAFNYRIILQWLGSREMPQKYTICWLKASRHRQSFGESIVPGLKSSATAFAVRPTLPSLSSVRPLIYWMHSTW